MLGFALVPDAGHETEPKDWERLDALVAQFAAEMPRDGGMSSDAQFLLAVRSDTICLALKGFATKPQGRAGATAACQPRRCSRIRKGSGS